VKVLGYKVLMKGEQIEELLKMISCDFLLFHVMFLT